MTITQDAAAMTLIEPSRAREIRERAGLSRARFALELDVDPATVHRWESGASRPRGGTRLRYARLLASLAEMETAA